MTDICKPAGDGEQHEIVVRLERVSKSYPAPGDSGRIQVLQELSLEVAAGRSIAITGPSGSGKTTLLNLIGCMDTPDSGEVVVAGQAVTGLDEDSLCEKRARDIGFVFQQHLLLPQCTALENVLVPSLAVSARADRNTANDRARELLERVGLAGRMDHRPGQLSGGEQQRVAVVRALINQPRVLLADEPTGNLDRGAADALVDLLVELTRERGLTLIIATHSGRLAGRMQKIHDLVNGKLEAG